jgi:hypothetical protein
MTYDLRKHVGEQQRMQEDYRNRGLVKWVERMHADLVKHALYSLFSDDGEWIVDTAALPVLTGQYADKQRAVELLRRRFVMDGWVRSEVLVEKGAPNVRLVLAGPRDALIVETQFGSIIPEVNPTETIQDAIHRFTRSGAVYYPTPWERVTVPPHSIRRIYQQTPDAPPVQAHSEANDQQSRLE